MGRRSLRQRRADDPGYGLGAGGRTGLWGPPRRSPIVSKSGRRPVSTASMSTTRPFPVHSRSCRPALPDTAGAWPDRHRQVGHPAPQVAGSRRPIARQPSRRGLIAVHSATTTYSTTSGSPDPFVGSAALRDVGLQLFLLGLQLFHPGLDDVADARRCRRAGRRRAPGCGAPGSRSSAHCRWSTVSRGVQVATTVVMISDTGCASRLLPARAACAPHHAPRRCRPARRGPMTTIAPMFSSSQPGQQFGHRGLRRNRHHRRALVFQHVRDSHRQPPIVIHLTPG